MWSLTSQQEQRTRGPKKIVCQSKKALQQYLPLPDFGRRDNFAGIGRADPPQSQPKGEPFFSPSTPQGRQGAD
jgi:hypothetical protein